MSMVFEKNLITALELPPFYFNAIIKYKLFNKNT